jgi:hypothetical protein
VQQRDQCDDDVSDGGHCDFLGRWSLAYNDQYLRHSSAI